MAVKFIQMQCPSCGANLEFEDGRDQVFCSYCGAKIMVRDDTKHEFIYRMIDEGKIAEEKHKLREAELDDDWWKREEASQRRAGVIGLWCAGIFTLLLILYVIFG